jgi:hypothetical protein
MSKEGGRGEEKYQLSFVGPGFLKISPVILLQLKYLSWMSHNHLKHNISTNEVTGFPLWPATHPVFLASEHETNIHLVTYRKYFCCPSNIHSSLSKTLFSSETQSTRFKNSHERYADFILKKYK